MSETGGSGEWGACRRRRAPRGRQAPRERQAPPGRQAPRGRQAPQGQRALRGRRAPPGRQALRGRQALQGTTGSSGRTGSAGMTGSSGGGQGATGGVTPETGGSTGGISPAFGTEPGVCGSADGFGRRTGSPQNVQNFASSGSCFRISYRTWCDLLFVYFGLGTGMVSGCGGMRPHLAGAVDAAGPQVCHCEEAAGRRAISGRHCPSERAIVKTATAPDLSLRGRPQADVAISGRHFQFVQGTDKNVPTNCVCSGVPCAAVGGFAALRMRRASAGSERLAGWQYSGHVFLWHETPKFVIPRSEATWESPAGSCAFADGFPTIRPGTARLPRLLRSLAMTNLIACFTRRAQGQT